jgi:type I restriction enzyme R subunit
MLDTGIDIPELVNLVFFKKIRSKTKFWQMIGRGTRLCEDLFGVGMDKDSFRIFDYCSNFEYFRENKMGKEAKLNKSLTENLFNIKVDIIKELQRLEYQDDEHISHRESLIGELLKSIQAIDENRFNARMKLQYIHRYNQKSAWENLKEQDIRELEEYIATLVTAIDDDELAKRFDFLMLTIEFADLKGMIASKPKMRVVTTADRLTTKGSIPQVKRHEELIFRVQTDEFWETANIFDYEIVRKAFRELIKFLEKTQTKDYYTNFNDEVLSVEENEGEYSVNNLQSYRKKVSIYLKEHQDDLVVYKLRNNKLLSKEDIVHLERILWEEIGTREDYINVFGEQPLLKLVSKIVGLEPSAANDAFSEFLSDESLNSNQMEFVKRIVNYVITNGIIEKTILNEQPFNKFGNVVDLFENKIETVRSIIRKIDELNARVDVG